MGVPEVHTDQIEIPTMGTKKLEWLSRAVMAKDEVHHNLILHIYHVRDENFMAMMEKAWATSGIMDQDITCELSYTDEFEGYEIDAYDAIFFKVDPLYAKAYKDMFVKALCDLYQEQADARNAESDGTRRQELHGAGGAEVPKVPQNSNRQDGPQEE